MNYQEKKNAKIDRYKELAKNARTQSTEKHDQSNSMVENIPLGQPILVGHHSENGHRRLLQRSRDTMDKAIELSDKAEYYEKKAESAESNNVISSDDPEAIRLLKDKLEKLETTRDRMKSVNKAWKKYVKTEDDKELKELGIEDIPKLKTQVEDGYSWDKQPYASYQLTNTGAAIRNTKKRIELMEKKKGQITREKMVGDIKIKDNVEENRLQLFFQGKPEAQIRTKLKENGFIWSPTNRCWQRQRTNQAVWSMKRLLEDIRK